MTSPRGLARVVAGIAVTMVTLLPVSVTASAAATDLVDLGLPPAVEQDLTSAEEGTVAAALSDEPGAEAVTVVTETSQGMQATILSVQPHLADRTAELLDDQPSVSVASVAQDTYLLEDPTRLATGSGTGQDAGSDTQSLAPDPYRSGQWALDRLRAEQFRPLVGPTSDRRPVVAVLDTGVDAAHEDLQGVLVGGYDATGTLSATVDGHGHGTHVAGIIAARVGNGLGVEGMLDDVAVMPVRVLLDSGSGNTAYTTAGVLWAVDNGADVINMSLGGTGYDPALEAAVDYADSMGVVVVAAAGNSAQTGNPVMYPGAFERALAVGASTSTDTIATFSSNGPHLDVAAPGQGIASTVPMPAGGSTAPAYASMSGTSMATPYAAGLAAAVTATFPQLDSAGVRGHLEATATDRGPAGFDDWFGFGIIDPYRALTTSPDGPDPGISAPVAVTAIPGDASATVSWHSPAQDELVTGYEVTLLPGAGVPRTVVVGPGARQTVVGGLANGVAYEPRVSALGSAGAGAPTTGAFVTPRTVPGVPRTVTAASGNASTSITWSPPLSDGGSPVTGYTLTATASGEPTRTATVKGTGHTFTGLTNGTWYAVTVRAVNAAGVGAPLSRSALAAGTPAATKVASTKPANRSVTATWTAPATGGTAITGYRVRLSRSGHPDVVRDVAATARATTVTGLVNGVGYTVRVRAKNAVGWGSSANSVAAVPRTVPTSVLSPTLGNGSTTDTAVSVTARWKAPASTGGSAVTRYEVLVRNESTRTTITRTASASARSLHVTKLSRGARYTVVVRAVNDAGRGPVSVRSGVATAR